VTVDNPFKNLHQRQEAVEKMIALDVRNSRQGDIDGT